MPEISITATAPSARFALPSDRGYLAGRHVWAQVEDGVATVGVTAPLGEVLWFQPKVDFWAVDRVEVGDTLATVQGRSARTVAIGSPVAGTLLELNGLLEGAPHALLAQPYARGWVPGSRLPAGSVTRPSSCPRAATAAPSTPSSPWVATSVSAGRCSRPACPVAARRVPPRRSVGCSCCCGTRSRGRTRP